MMATFRPHRLTNSLDSPWWYFTVSAYNGRNWTKHCTGEVCALSSPPEKAEEPDALPRKLSVRKWFEKMAKGGLNLGTSFQTLDTMATSTADQRAMGHVVNGRQGDEAHYYIHPTVLDAILQILGASAVNGYARKTKTWLPTSIDQIKVYRCAADMVTNVSANCRATRQWLEAALASLREERSWKQSVSAWLQQMVPVPSRLQMDTRPQDASGSQTSISWILKTYSRHQQAARPVPRR